MAERDNTTVAHASPEVAHRVVRERREQRMGTQEVRQRLIDAPPHQFWGEAIVGSVESREVPLPTLLPNFGIATVSAVVDSGGNAFHTAPVFATIHDGVQPRASGGAGITVMFEPKKSGDFAGTLLLTASWGDGHVEKQRVLLFGRARTLEQAPAGALPPESMARKIVSSPAPWVLPRDGAEPMTGSVETKGTTASWDPLALSVNHTAALHHASTEVTALGSAMRRGVELTKDTASSYKARPESDSIWLGLAKLAVMAGMTPIAGAVGAFVARSLTRFAVARYFNVSSADVVVDEDMVKGFTRVLDRPIRKLGEGAFDAAMSSAATKSGRATEASARFFASQLGGVDEFVRQSQHALAEQWGALVPLLRSDPKMAADLLAAMQEAFALHASLAESSQAAATSRAWITFRGRDALGEETVETLAGPAKVTRMSKVRDWSHNGLGAPASAKGLLDINVTLREGIPSVQGARLEGVAQSVADVLLDTDLGAARMPCRIVIGWSGAFITVDEAGRARVSGALSQFMNDGVPTTDEAKAHKGAQRLVDLVFAKSLRNWGLHHVTTDDDNEDKA